MEFNTNLVEGNIFLENFGILERLLEVSTIRTKGILNILEVPLFFYKKEILNTPYFESRLPISRYQHTPDKVLHLLPNIHSYNTHINEEMNLPNATCLVEITQDLREPLIFECSSASLNLSLNSSKGSSVTSLSEETDSIKNDESPTSPNSILEQGLTVLTLAEEKNVNADQRSAMSTSSSSSSTKEYYLPASTGSNDTFRVADVLTTEMPLNCLERNINTDIPKKTFKHFKWNNIKKSSSYNNEFLRNVTNFKPLTDTEDIIRAYRNTRSTNYIVDRYKNDLLKSRNERLAVILKGSKISPPVISVNKFCDGIFMNLRVNRVRAGENNVYSDKVIDTNKQSLIKNKYIYNKKDFLSAQDFVNEINDNNLKLNEEIIESGDHLNETIQSLGNLNSIILSNPKTQVTTKKDNFIQMKTDLEKDVELMGKNKITIKDENKIELNNKTELTLNTNIQRDKQNSLETIPDGMPKILIQSKDFESECYGKFKKLHGFFDESSQKPLISKLLIPSNVIVEDSGNNMGNDSLNDYFKKSKKRVRLNCHDQLSRFGELNMSLNDIKSSGARTNFKIRENDESTSSNALVYNESILSDEYNFQKLKERFELNKVSYSNKDSIITPCSIHYYARKAHNSKTELNETVFKSESYKNNNLKYKKVKDIKLEQSSLDVRGDSKTVRRDTVDKKQTKVTEELGDSDKPILKKGLISKNGQPALVYDRADFPLTDLKGRILKNNVGIPLLNVKNYHEIIENNLVIYDADKTSINSSSFDPSKKPVINTIAKVTDRVGNPAALYNNLGLPLTSDDGLLLHDSNGELLVTLDSKFFPLCCKNGSPIYLKNGTTWLNQRYKYIVSTQNRVSDVKEEKCTSTSTISARRESDNFLLKQTLKKDHLFRNDFKKSIGIQCDSAVLQELTDPFKIHLPRNLAKQERNILNRLESLRQSHSISNSATEFLLDLLPRKKLHKKNRQKENISRSTIPIYDKDGNCLTDKQGYPLYNRYGESMLLFDKHGQAISDSYGNPIFDSSGDQLLTRSTYEELVASNNIYSRERYVPPERPYCDQTVFVTNNSSESFAQNEPSTIGNSYHQENATISLINILRKKHINAWDIYNEVPSSVRSVYSLSNPSRVKMDETVVEEVDSTQQNYILQNLNVSMDTNDFQQGDYIYTSVPEDSYETYQIIESQDEHYTGGMYNEYEGGSNNITYDSYNAYKNDIPIRKEYITNARHIRIKGKSPQYFS